MAALHAYRILETAPEEAFDAITRLAAANCEVPIDFIPVAEETGLIIQIGERVLWEACG